MYTQDDENKYKNVIDDLKNLKKLEAPVGFESKLWNRINSSESTEVNSVWAKLTLKLAPAVALAASVVILFTIIDNNATEYQDPFMIEPEERTDLITFSTDGINLHKSESDSKSIPELEQPKEQAQEKSTVKFRKKEVADSKELSVGRQIEGRSEAFSDEDSVEPELSAFAISDTTDKLIGNEEMVAPAVSVPMQQNLNFRQIQLSEEEQREVIELKSKTLGSEKSRQK
jgi:hypothetical protein